MTHGLAQAANRFALDQIAGATAAVLDVPVVMISVLDGKRQTVIGSHGMPAPPRRELSPLCLEVAVLGRPIVMQDARPRLDAGAHRHMSFEFGGYAGVPLVLDDGRCVGTIAGFARARRTWQDRDLLVLRSLGQAVSAILDMERRVDVAGLGQAIAPAANGDSFSAGERSR